MRSRLQLILGALGTMIATLGGCAGTQTGQIEAAQPWLLPNIDGTTYFTKHYQICTTVHDKAFIARFARLMEACHTEYERQLPSTNIDRQRPEIDLLTNDKEWEALASVAAGPEAASYLRVGSGGFTIGDRVVCRLISEANAFSVSAHEGLHQYIARRFPRRLPPTIEEGLATRFENVSVSATEVAFDFDHNPRRQQALRAAVAHHALIPLDVLIQLNAGDVVGRGPASEIYYGQCWALAQMLTRDPSYHDEFQKLIVATAIVTTPEFEQTRTATTEYQPEEVHPLLQKYVAADWPTFTKAYRRWINKLTTQP